MTGIPYGPQEAFIRMLLVASLIIIVVLLSKIKKIGIEKDYIIGLLKGGVQLFILALFLTYLFSSPFWFLLIWIIILAMIFIGGHTSAKRALNMPNAFEITTPSILIGSTVVITVLALSGAMPMEPQFIIPLSGMAFGNTMAICSLSLERYMREIKLNKNIIETALSLGATPDNAIKDLNRITIRAALVPTIDRLKTLGIIFIPGAMTGLLMAGTNPIVAAEYQMIVYFMITCGGVITAITTVGLAKKKVFTDAYQIAEWVYRLN